MYRAVPGASLFRRNAIRVAIGIAFVLGLLVIPEQSAAVAAGEIAWTHQFGSAGDDIAAGVAIDAARNTYVVGRIGGALPGQTSAGGYDAFVRKYDASGKELWTHQFGTAGLDDALDVAVDSSGNAYVVGYTRSPLPGQTSAGGYDAFVRKYDVAGNEIWTRQFGTAGLDEALDVAVDATGSAYITGLTNGTFAGQTWAGDYDVFVRKYDAAGTELWTRQFGTAGTDEGIGLAVDPTGNAYVAGFTAGVLPGQTSAGGWDVFARKYDTTGNEIWTRQFGTAGIDRAYGVAVDASGHAYVVGRTNGVLSGQVSSGDHDAFVRQYDAAGNEIWTRQFGSAGPDSARGIAVDVGENSYVSGEVLGTLPGQTSLGDNDAFVRKYSAAGSELWTHQFSSAGADRALRAAVGTDGNVHIVGSTTGTLSDQNSSGGEDAFVVRLGELADTTPPWVNVPGDITVEATQPAGAVVSFSASAVDAVDGAVTPVCEPGSGSTFPIGMTTVNCSAFDRQGNTTADSFTVTVQDTTPPETTMVSAVDGTGAAVTSGESTLSNSMTFTFVGVDEVGLAGFQCKLDADAFGPCAGPQTYSVLAAGSHTFSVRALDIAGNADPTPESLTWTVLTPAQANEDLITTVGAMGLLDAVAASLSAPLGQASTLLNDNNPSNDAGGCGKLDAFAKQIGANTKNGQLTPTQADQLLLAADAIRISLGC